LAKELKVDLSTLKGSGPHGRIAGWQPTRANNPTEKRHRKNSPVAPPAAPEMKPVALPPAAACATPIAPAADQVVFLTTLQTVVEYS